MQTKARIYGMRNKVQYEVKAEDNGIQQITTYNKRCRERLCIVLLLDAIILCLCFILHLVSHAIYPLSAYSTLYTIN